VHIGKNRFYKVKHKKDTFFALSTPPGKSATSTIRVSGPRSPYILEKITKRHLGFFKPSKSTLVSLYNKNNTLIDKCLVVYYRKPRSYTGENVIEIHTHGNPIIIQSLFNVFLKLGIRLARAGEFTKTAYKNNKIDLVQAEAVFNLINAQSRQGVNLSLNNLEGKLSNEFSNIRKNLRQALSLIEYELDISETDTQTKTTEMVYNNIIKTNTKIKKLIKSHKASKILISGAKVVIVGKPNVGKSTLFNLFLNYERSIVTNTPGTTRDTLEASIVVGGFTINLVDTAGIRKTSDPIEKIGVQKTQKEVESSNLILLVVDKKPTKKQLKLIKKTPTIVVFNKSDLLNKNDKFSVKNNNNIDIILSAKNNKGLGKLLKNIKNKLSHSVLFNENFYITSTRQKEVLGLIKTDLNKLLKTKNLDLELVAIEIKGVINHFDWLLGKTTPDDILNNLFSNFCVGK